MKKLIHNNFLEYIKNLDKDSSIELAESIFYKIKYIHSFTDSELNWRERFESDLNLSLYKNGLNKSYGPKDYILIDKLNKDKFIINERVSSKFIQDNSILNIDIIDDTVFINESDFFGDRLLDYLDLNIIAYYNIAFANKMISLAYENEEKYKFYRLFSYYSAKYLLDLIIFKNKLKNTEEIEEYEEIINFIYESFLDFTTDKPLWA